MTFNGHIKCQKGHNDGKRLLNILSLKREGSGRRMWVGKMAEFDPAYRQSADHLGNVGLCNVMARGTVRQERHIVGQRPRSAAVFTVRLLHTHITEGLVFPERSVCVAYSSDVFKGEDTAVGWALEGVPSIFLLWKMRKQILKKYIYGKTNIKSIHLTDKNH